MSRLIKAEFRRALARGITKGVLLMALLFAGFTMFAMSQQVSNLPSQAQLRSDFDTNHADWTKNHVQWEKDCKASMPPDDPKASAMCAQPEPKWADYVGMNGTRGGIMHQGLPGLLPVAGLLALVLGASLVCAEFTTGSMMTWLTFEPRRVPVYVSKVLVATVMGLLTTLVLVALAGPGFWLISGTGDLEFAAGEKATYFATLARLLGVGAFCGLVGAALGFLLRHTTAVLGAAAVWLIAVELIASNAFDDARRWTISVPLSAFVNHGHGWQTYPPCYNGDDCKPVDHWLGFWPATTYLLVLAALLFVVGLLNFRRRDVG